MRVKVYNTQYDRRSSYFFTVPEFHYYEGEPATVKWAGAHELAIRTNDSVGLRIIQRRNIREIDGQAYEYTEGVTQALAKTVQGSRGDVYTVTATTCTCPGYQFRRACRHVREFQQA